MRNDFDGSGRKLSDIVVQEVEEQRFIVDIVAGVNVMRFHMNSRITALLQSLKCLPDTDTTWRVDMQ